MSAPLPEALRARFQRYIEEGLSGRAAALRLKLSPATGARWALAIRRTGRAEAAPQGRPKGRGKLDPHRDFFAELIAQDGDITMPELSAALFDASHVRAHPNAIGKFLRKLAFMYTLIVSCKMNDVDPHAWMADVLARMPDISVSRLPELLPWSWRAQQEAVKAA